MDHVYVALNVGGKMFYIGLACLRSIPRTLLTDLMDASLPFDLVFGGKAISETDEVDSVGIAKGRYSSDSLSEMSHNPTGISTNGAVATSSHPYDRAKYVYLSRSNTLRPIRFTAPSRSSNTMSSTSRNTQDKKSSNAVSSSSSSAAAPLSTLPQTSSLDPTHSSSCLFVPATCFTSPRHKPVLLPCHKSKHKMEGFTNKSFLADEDSMGRTRTETYNHVDLGLRTSSAIDNTKTDGYDNHHYIPNPEGPHDDNTDVGEATEVDASSLVRLPQAVDADIYIDRNPVLFPYILDLYRHGHLHLPPDVCSLTIRMELDFWKIPEELIGECCWREFQNGIDRMDVVSAISATLTDRYDDPEVRGQLGRAGRVWLTMERPDYGKRAKAWCCVYYSCILLSTITFMMLSLVDFQEVKPEFEQRLEEYANDNDTLHVVHYGTFFKPVGWLEITEICLDIFFTLEFAARLVTCPDKKDFVRNKHNIIDILILSTAWTRCVYDRIITWDHQNFTEARSFAMVVLNSLLGLRVLRMLHLAKIFRTLKVMYLSILASMQELALLVVVMAAGVLLFGSVLFIAEGFSTADSDPLQFASIPEAMWWAIITMTTVGYGDYYPTHAAGYVVGAICAVSGLLLVAMPIAIVASNFSTFYDNMSSRDQSLRRQAMFGQMIGVAMATQGGAASEDGKGGDEEQAAVKENCDKPVKNVEISDSVDSLRHSSRSKLEYKDGDLRLDQQTSATNGISENGDTKHLSKESSHRKDTGESRKERHELKQKSSGSSKRDSHSFGNGKVRKENSNKTIINVGQEVKFHKFKDYGPEVNSSRKRDRSPMTVDYVGLRANGRAKEESDDRQDSRDRDLRSNISEYQVSTRNSRSRHRSGHAAQHQLSPVG